MTVPLIWLALFLMLVFLSVHIFWCPSCPFISPSLTSRPTFSVVPIVQRTLHSALPVHLLLRVHLFATAFATFTRASFWQVFCIFRPAVRLFFGVPHVILALLLNAYL